MIAVAAFYRRSFFDGLSVPQSCQACRGGDAAAIRATWGCDRSTITPQLRIPCVRCAGEDPACEICRGSGHESIYDCPRRLLSEDEDALQLFSLFSTYPQALPCAGGLYDQPARYLAAMRVIGHATRELEQQIARDQEWEESLGRGAKD